MAGSEAVVTGLNGMLADATVLYQKLRHYHWNVEGRTFFELHEKFEALYTAWSVTIDEVAERIRMIGGVPLHTLGSILNAATLKEDESVPAAAEMVEAIVADLKALHARAGRVIEAAEEVGDRGTANLLDGIRDGMEKDIWMLGAWARETARSWG